MVDAVMVSGVPQILPLLVPNERPDGNEPLMAHVMTSPPVLVGTMVEMVVKMMRKAMKDENEARKIMEEIRTLGYIPKYRENRGLARRYHQAVKDGKISLLDQQEAKKLTAEHVSHGIHGMRPQMKLQTD